jgi:hypothetical protein
MTTYRIVEVKRNHIKYYIAQRKGWFGWHTIKQYSADSSYRYDLTFDTYELALASIKGLKPYEYKVVSQEIKI